MIEIDILPASSAKKGGDSALIRIGKFNYSHEANNQKVILIDGGYAENADRIKNHLKTHYQTDIIDLAIITHPDMDHLSGFRKLLELNEIKIKKTCIHDPWLHTNEIFQKTEDRRITKKSLGRKFDETLSCLSNTLDLLEKQGVPNSEPFGYKKIDNLNIHILGPSREYYRSLLYQFPNMEGESGFSGKTEIYAALEINYRAGIDHFLENPRTSPKNNSSAIILIENEDGEAHALFTGDAGTEAITHALNTADRNKINYTGINLLQIPHHGSIKNISEEILDRISPKKAYVSAPSEHDEHPSPLLINHILGKGIKLFHIKDKNGVVFYHKTNNKRPDWGSANPAEMRSRVRPLRQYIDKFRATLGLK